MKCVKCERAINVGYMCDRSSVTDVRCKTCFGKTCEKRHPEDCLTMVFDDEPVQFPTMVGCDDCGDSIEVRSETDSDIHIGDDESVLCKSCKDRRDGELR